MIKLPLIDVLGEFGYFFEEIEFNHYIEECNNILPKEMARIYIVSERATSQTAYCGPRMVSTISKSEYEKYLHPTLPYWLRYDDVFDGFTQGDNLSVLPKSAEIITTLNCCFRCQQCSYRVPKENLGIWDSSYNKHAKQFDMSSDDVKTVVERLYHAGVQNVVFTGGGEPLANAKTTLLGMKACKDVGINAGLYTNGYLLDDEIINELCKINPLFIRASIYGMDAESFSKYTRVSADCFDKTLNNIKQVLEAKRQGRLSSIITLSFLVHPILYPYAETISSFFNLLFTNQELDSIASIRFTPAVDYFHNAQHEKAFFDSVLEQLIKVSIEHCEHTLVVPYNHRFEELYKLRDYKQCLANGYFAEIAPNGDMYLCCEKLMENEYRIGNIIEAPIIEVYNSEKRIDIINRINFNECRDCPPVCKPHELNKIVNVLPSISRNRLVEWREKLLEISIVLPYYPGRFNAFES
jgi:radical SAM protein with 4Fe4S-binding SPASM domain